MKTTALTTILAFTIASASLMADESHHQGKGSMDATDKGVMKSQSAMSMGMGMGDDMMDMERMQERMTDMQRMMDRIKKTQDPKKRRDLLQTHMQDMHEMMDGMDGMMGGGMMMGNSSDMPMEQRQKMMEQRMDMMQQFMEQMMEQMMLQQQGQK